MAELVLIPETRGDLGEGDIFKAHNDVSILWRHTQLATNHRKMGGDFFKPLGCLAHKRLEAVSKFRFQELDKFRLRITNLITGISHEKTGPEFEININGVAAVDVRFPGIWNYKNARQPEPLERMRRRLLSDLVAALEIEGSKLGNVQVLSPLPGGSQPRLRINGEFRAYSYRLLAPKVTDLPMYMARRKKKGVKPMFGSEGSVVWYEGHREITVPILSDLWTTEITPRTGLLEADHRKNNYTSRYLKRHLVIAVNDFTNTRRGRLEEPHYDRTDPENPVFISKRKHKIDWQNMEGMSGQTVADVLDRKKIVQVKRDLIRTETDLVIEK